MEPPKFKLTFTHQYKDTKITIEKEVCGMYEEYYEFFADCAQASGCIGMYDALMEEAHAIRTQQNRLEEYTQ